MITNLILIIMGTGNFKNVNASRVYAVMPECSCEGGCWCFQEDFMMFKDGLLDQLKAVGYESTHQHVDDDRSYPGQTIARKAVQYGSYGEVIIRAVVRSAYYEGINLDWEIEYYIDSLMSDEYVPEFEDIEGQLNWLFDENPGLAKIQASNYLKFFEDQRDKLIEELEKVYEQETTPLNCIGTASNGEAFYVKV